MEFKDIVRKIINTFGIDVVRYPTYDMVNVKNILNTLDIDLILDVGANIGQYVKFIRQSGYEKNIISFEPLKVEYQKLIEKNSKDTQWTGYNIAFGDEDGNHIINRSENSVSSSLLEPIKDFTIDKFEGIGIQTVAKEEIKVSKLDTFFQDNPELLVRNIFLKMDVQGFEMEILNGGLNTLHQFKAIQIELNFNPVYHGSHNYESIVSFLKERNFKLIYLIPGFANPKTGELIESDGIFVKVDRV